ncbi:hypothetical protein OROGR_007003 [Orobanche gracilis]
MNIIDHLNHLILLNLLTPHANMGLPLKFITEVDHN